MPTVTDLPRTDGAPSDDGAPSRAARDEEALVAALRTGDADAFRELVRTHHAGLVRLARLYAPASVVDEVVQETWVGVIRGLDQFEGRSSLKTWIHRILLNQARRRGSREARSIPFAPDELLPGPGSVVASDRLQHPELGSGYWPDTPPPWDSHPEGRLLGREVREVVQAAIDRLPRAQRVVITLRDVEGWSSAEVCDVLDLTAVNQRALLHRARVAVRDIIEEYVHG